MVTNIASLETRGMRDLTPQEFSSLYFAFGAILNSRKSSMIPPHPLAREARALALMYPVAMPVELVFELTGRANWADGPPRRESTQEANQLDSAGASVGEKK